MTIVLNEREWAADMIASRSLGKKPYETLCRVARYYIDSGDSKKEARHKLDVFLLRCDPSASLPKWGEALDKAVGWALKHEAVDIEKIVVTKPELEKIHSLKGKQIQRLAFTLLCLAKYWDIVTKSSAGWVNNKDSDIMRMANINTSIKRQSLMFYNLRDAGMIEFSRKVDNTNVRVCFMEDGEAAVEVRDFRNLGYQLMMHDGGAYFVCANCGMTDKFRAPGKGRTQKYCKSCAAELAIQRRINYSMCLAERRASRKRRYTVYMHEFPDGTIYIGSTQQSLNERWKNGAGYQGQKVGDAIERAGWENIRHFILADDLDSECARDVEGFLIEKYKSYLSSYGYNVRGIAVARDAELPKIIKREVNGRGEAIA